MTIPSILEVQRYCIHDGEGIRTTVFFKGCPLRCRWCHNPESQSYARELLVHAERCTGCGACAVLCPSGAVSLVHGRAATDRSRCTLCGACAAACGADARALAGLQLPLAELYARLERDQPFYEQSGGGVTLSGGEAAAQDPEYIEALARRLTRRGIRVNLDTCGHAPSENLLRLLPYTDTFLYDLKLLDDARHREWTGCGNALILENLVALAARGARIHLRVPVIGGVNADADSMRAMASFVREQVAPGRVERVYLLPYHDTGSGKYERLGRIYEQERMFRPDDAALQALRRVFLQNGLSDVRIGG